MSSPPVAVSADAVSAAALPADWQLRIPATREAAEDLCQQLRLWLAGLHRKDAFAVELLVREALANGIDHSLAHTHPSTPAILLCRFRRKANRILFFFADPGPGFDWQSQMRQQPLPDSPRGRGLALFRRYAARVRFNRAGNQLLLVRHLQENSAGARPLLTPSKEGLPPWKSLS